MYCGREIPLKCWYGSTKLHTDNILVTAFWNEHLCIKYIHPVLQFWDTLILVAKNETTLWRKWSSSLHKLIRGLVIQWHHSYKHRRTIQLSDISQFGVVIIWSDIGCMEKVALGLVYLWALQLPHISRISPILHAHSVIHNWGWPHH